jgi:hypothetical protein
LKNRKEPPAPIVERGCILGIRVLGKQKKRERKIKKPLFINLPQWELHDKTKKMPGGAVILV